MCAEREGESAPGLKGISSQGERLTLPGPAAEPAQSRGIPSLLLSLLSHRGRERCHYPHRKYLGPWEQCPREGRVYRCVLGMPGQTPDGAKLPESRSTASS